MPTLTCCGFVPATTLYSGYVVRQHPLPLRRLIRFIVIPYKVHTWNPFFQRDTHKAFPMPSARIQLPPGHSPERPSVQAIPSPTHDPAPCTHVFSESRTIFPRLPGNLHLNLAQADCGEKSSGSRCKSHVIQPLRKFATQNRTIWHREVPYHDSLRDLPLNHKDLHGNNCMSLIFRAQSAGISASIVLQACVNTTT